MKNCTDCKHAHWERTAAGKLHPNGDGKCHYPLEMPALPAAMYWTFCSPLPSGGFINRRRDNESHCTYWARVT
jgi:hypothetical protein